MLDTMTAPLTFSDDWDDEPTMVDHEMPTAGRISDWRPYTGAYAAFSDRAIVAALASADDPTVTYRELPAVAA